MDVTFVINKFTCDYTVPISQCDHNAKLSFMGIFNIFMDLATEHAALLKVSNKDLDNCFWVAAKTRVRCANRPEMMHRLTASTWPQEPGNIRCNRFCTLEDAGGIVAEGKTEWTIIDAETCRPMKTKNIYPAELVHLEDEVCAEPFARIGTDFADCEVLKKHTVVSADIDLSKHMNNVAYIRAVMSAFTCEQIDGMNITEIEIAYRAQCFEGEELTICKRQSEDGMDIGVIKADGTTAAVLRIK